MNGKDAPQKGRRTRHGNWKSIVGGDILDTDFCRRQTRLLLLVTALVIFYIHNRYACQQQMLEVDRLRKVRTDLKYDALTRNAELMERSRQSHIEEYIATRGSELQTATTPPYLVE